MRASNVLPLEARRAAWDRLWRILLAPPGQDEQPVEAMRSSRPDDSATPDSAGSRGRE